MDRNRFEALTRLDPSLRIEELEKQIQALKRSLSMASGPAPIDEGSIPHPLNFAAAIHKTPDKPPPARSQNVRSFWRARGASNLDEVTRGSIVKEKIASLRASSSLQNPVCFRCTKNGHATHDCRNGVICFLCNKLGHRVPQCHSVTINPPPVRSKPHPSVIGASSPLTTVFVTKPLLKHPICPPIMSKSMKAPIRTLYETVASEAQE